MTLLEHVIVVVRLPTVGYHLKGGKPSIISALIVIRNIIVLVIGIEPLQPSVGCVEADYARISTN